MDLNVIGHHGTDKGSGHIILKTKIFNVSKKVGLWLGDGIYFFENKKSMAHEWCKSDGFKKNYKEYCIIETNIKVDNNEVLNLDDKEGQEIFHLQREGLVKRLSKTQYGVKTTTQFLDGEIINDICSIIPYKVVRQRMFVQLTKDRIMKVQSRVPNCGVLNVRDANCVKNPTLIEEGVL